jgi:hypothetical protein
MPAFIQDMACLNWSLNFRVAIVLALFDMRGATVITVLVDISLFSWLESRT